MIRKYKKVGNKMKFVFLYDYTHTYIEGPYKIGKRNMFNSKETLLILQKQKEKKRVRLKQRDGRARKCDW